MPENNSPQPHSNFNIPAILGKDLEKVDDIIKHKAMHVRLIEIPKKDGSKRKVLSPDGTLKYIQKSLYWKFFRRYKPSSVAHGFVSKHGIVTNAKLHVGAKALGKIDIKSFFDTICEKHLKNCLFGNKHICRYCKNYEKMLDGKCNPSLYKNKHKNFPHRCEEMKAVFIPEFCEKTGYQSLFNRVIELCTFEGSTAQGFPTSPVIANIVMRGFDKTMSKFCEENNVTYTRYADDLAFSSKDHDKKVLKGLIKSKAYRLLWAYGFKPNRKKTSWKSYAGRLKVCGVVVNEKTSIQKSEVHRFRAKVHHAVVKHAEQTTKSDLRRLKGWASYLMSVDKSKGDKYMTQLVTFEKSKFGNEEPMQSEDVEAFTQTV